MNRQETEQALRTMQKLYASSSWSYYYLEGVIQGFLLPDNNSPPTLTLIEEQAKKLIK